MCGLVGHNISHSYSKEIHALLGKYEYGLFDIPPEEFDSFMKNAPRAFNITMPYKQRIIKYCDSLSQEARDIGAVNTFVDGKGYNTDYLGILHTLKDCEISQKKILVLGSGATANTVKYCLKMLNAGETVTVSRTGTVNYDNVYKHSDAYAVINTTPVGMYPHFLETPVDITRFTECKLVFDVIYNPLRTFFLTEAKLARKRILNGMTLLVSQAAHSSALFTGDPVKDVSIITGEFIKSKRNIVLIGMPGCGKTTYGKALAKKSGMKFFDTDALIGKRTGMKANEFFEKYGEKHFRTLEADVINDIALTTSSVISTGGGAVLSRKNMMLLSLNGKIVYLKRALNELDTKNRPAISAAGGVEALYEKRRALYEYYADSEEINSIASL